MHTTEQYDRHKQGTTALKTLELALYVISSTRMDILGGTMATTRFLDEINRMKRTIRAEMERV